MRFCFVILHYQASDVTRKCVDNILSKFPGEENSVVVVDNCSPDGSGRRLKSEYIPEKRVHFECTRDSLKMLYDPSLRVDHLEDASTKAAYVQSLDVLN